MDLDTVEQYLTRVADEMPKRLSDSLDLSLARFLPIHVTVRPLLCPTLAYNSSKKIWHMYIPQPRIYMLRGDKVKEFEMAQMELEAVHEISHVVHTASNPKMHQSFEREKKLLKTLPEDMRTPAYEMFLTVAEIAAEYTAWFFIDLLQGVETFLSRAYNREREEDLERIKKKHCLGESQYDLTKLAFLAHKKEGSQNEFCRQLLVGRLDEIVQIRHIGDILRRTEKYIFEHSEKYSGCELFHWGCQEIRENYKSI